MGFIIFDLFVFLVKGGSWPGEFFLCLWVVRGVVLFVFFFVWVV